MAQVFRAIGIRTEVAVKEFPEVEVRSRQELRAWLQDNHASSGTIWLITYKKAKPEFYVNYDTIVEEALCFGWIDSQIRRIDEERLATMYAPRKRGSGWSRRNKNLVAKLMETGQIMPPGLAVIERAKLDGSWSRLDDIENGVIPPDLQRAFDSEPGVEAKFLANAPSLRRAFLEQLQNAKTPETRAKRIQKILDTQ
jgi:uncharacterized protein YdeI (YjbR/CyaY-like superfamily)